MSATPTIHLLRFLLVLLLQTMVFQQVSLGDNWLRFAEVLIYPIFIMMAPLRWHSAAVISASFLLGLLVDSFADTPGVHAATATATAFVRPVILNIIAPRAGYDPNQTLTRATFGLGWWTSYTALFLFVHCLIYASLTVFTVYHFAEILLRTILTMILSFTVIILQDLLFSPRA